MKVFLTITVIIETAIIIKFLIYPAIYNYIKAREKELRAEGYRAAIMEQRQAENKSNIINFLVNQKENR